MQFNFPGELRPATVEERREFYRSAFPRDEVAQRMDRWDKFVPVIDVGADTTRYRPRFKQYKGKLVRITDFDGVEDLATKIVDYAPEDLYYVTTIEKADRVETNPERELVFDIDPEDVDCEDCRRRKQHLDDTAAAYTFCEDCFAAAATATRQLHAFLENHFSQLDLVYSGRGFHIHVGDGEAFQMDREDRRRLAGKVAKEFPIDTQVTAGEKDLIRMPGSLHGLVSKVVTPIEPGVLTSPDHILTSVGVPEFLATDIE
ncbi:MAG: DNA primase small subunit domain-containing protein [Candidatus Nanohaloarchaea archaeon]|nr:DNA primase small subunit domain-containing protein [Candidatus Nanohaloarchaea archaeon]